MFNRLDLTIRQVLDTGWTTAAQPAKPGFFFTPPDEDWQTAVQQGANERLNIYLYEVRENREWRRAEWDTVFLSDGSTAVSRPPAYIDCHYLITAWSPAEDGEATTPVLDEHAILGEAMRVLMRTPEVVPGDIGIAGGGAVFQEARVCLTVAPPEAPRVLNDFWSTMKLPWRPAIILIATAPLDLLLDAPPAPLMTTLVQRYGIGDPIGAAEEFIQIGGWVLRAADESPVAEATVRRLGPGGAILEETTTDAQGRFTFRGLRRGITRLEASAAGLTTLARDLDLPVAPPEDHIFALS
jgi:hypothetical protein